MRAITTRIITVTLAVALGFTGLIVSVDYANAQASKECKYIQTASLKQGDVGGDVKAAQSILGAVNFYSGIPSGVYDKTTSGAVSTFQWAFGYKQTSVIDAETRNLLNNVCSGDVPLPPFLASLPKPTPDGLQPADVIIELPDSSSSDSVQLVQEEELVAEDLLIELLENTDDDLVVNPLPVVQTPVATVDKIEAPGKPELIDTSGPITKELRWLSYNEEVVILEDFLIDRGFLSTKSNRFLGMKTKKSIADFQQAIGLSVSGRIDELTRSLINQIINSGQ